MYYFLIKNQIIGFIESFSGPYFESTRFPTLLLLFLITIFVVQFKYQVILFSLNNLCASQSNFIHKLKFIEIIIYLTVKNQLLAQFHLKKIFNSASLIEVN